MWQSLTEKQPVHTNVHMESDPCLVAAQFRTVRSGAVERGVPVLPSQEKLAGVAAHHVAL